MPCNTAANMVLLMVGRGGVLEVIEPRAVAAQDVVADLRGELLHVFR